MYLEYFSLQEPPFSITPDPRFLYFSQRHKEALAHLLYSVSNRSGFVLLTGEVGTGKTTLCRTLLEQLPEQVDLALILNPRLTAAELVATICDELAIPYPPGATSMKILVDALNGHLLRAHEEGRQTIVIIDEAQSLIPEVLEQIRLLTNLETATVKLLQIFLIGQPELQKLLAREDLRQLAQRITARYHITPLHRGEVAEYVGHRLKVAGCPRPLFTAAALKRIHALTEGVPRLINKVCDRSLLGAYSLGSGMVTPAIVRKAAAEVLDIRRGGVSLHLKRWAALAAAGTALLLAVVIVAERGLTLLEVQRDTRPVLTAVVETAPAPSPPPVEAAPPLPPPPSPPPVVVEAAPPLPPPPPAEPAPAPPPAEEVAPPPVPEAAPSPVPPPPALPVRIRSTPAEFTLESAFARLMGLWGKKYQADSAEMPCKVAEKHGLLCLHLTGNWNTLRLYDRPAVLALISPGGERWHVLLSRLEKERVVLALPGGEELAVAMEEVDTLWFGAITLLWEPPFPGAPILKAGMRRKEVAWVREHLALALGAVDKKGGDRELFDAELAERVKKFQTANLIYGDGLVGPVTFFKLGSAEGAVKGHPTLTPR